jgi:hypothetical protein
MGHIPGAGGSSYPLYPWQELEQVLADLKAISTGTGPTEADLDEAPTLALWTHATTPTPCLAGYVQDHPRLGDGKLIATSMLWAINYERRWARTNTRWYSLGQGIDKPRFVP